MKNLPQGAGVQENLYLRLIENIPEVVWRANEKGDAIFISERISSVFGYRPEDLLQDGSRLWFGRMHPEDRPRVTEEYAELFRTGKQFDTQYRIQHRDGHWMWWHDRAVIARDPASGCMYADGLLSDISEVKKLQEQLQQSQKMEAVGQLAGGIAHDFNNLIQVISGHVELLEKIVEDQGKAREHAVKIKRAAARAASLTQQLLAFSRKQVQQVRVLDLNETVSQFCQMLGRGLGESIQLDVRLAPSETAVKADQTQIEQLLMNLAVNARDAMPMGGRLTIETQRTSADGNHCQNSCGFAPGEYAVIVVSDTGVGMDAQTLAHIFEPFFTTKERGKGTGLGLATVYGIVKDNGGHIHVDSKVDSGSVFRVYLPAVNERPMSSRSSQSPFSSKGGAETILLVEDEPAVRDLATLLLERLGYTVISASDCRDAIAVAERFAGEYQLLITDVVMPGGSGRDLAKRLASCVPNLKTLYMTGYTDDALLRNQLLESNLCVLRKPFTKDQLASAVRSALGEQSFGDLAAMPALASD